MIFTKSQRWELIGIKSYANDCTTEQLNIYTRITAFLPFIQTTINNTLSKTEGSVCACQCPQQIDREFFYTRMNSTDACITTCEIVAMYGCDSSNTDVCNSTTCLDSTSIFYNDSNTYEGIYIRLKGDICKGQFKKERMHGKGTCQFANEDSYTGDWVNGKRTGKGVFTWQTGGRYEGEFINDHRTGYGVYYWRSGDKYKGHFKDDQMHGIGTYYYSNGNNYTGGWVDNDQTGYGVLTSANGDRYEGQFQNDGKHGTGIMYFANGDKYTGDWFNDERTGYGLFIWTSGDRYQRDYSLISRDQTIPSEEIHLDANGIINEQCKGQFKNSYRHGRGLYFFSDGNAFAGDWLEGNRTGHGVFTWPNGNRYEGQFKDNQRHGKGTQYFAFGANYTGDWLDDERTGSGIFNWKDGTRYERTIH